MGLKWIASFVLLTCNDGKVKKNKKFINKIINNVSEILKFKGKNSSADVSIIEKEIDNLVYELYNLSNEEIKIVEGK